MEKKLKDYLHLYIGCECIYNNKLYVLTGTNKPYLSTDTTFFRIDLRVKGKGFRESTSSTDMDKTKLILRPLSDMTSKESDYILPEALEGKPTIIVNAASTAWLLSKHFDLFGLIDAGLAIDKSQLNHPLGA